MLLLGLAAGWAAVELLFYAWNAHRRQKVGDLPVPSPAVPPEALPALQERILDLHHTMDCKLYLERWFDGAPFETIRHENILAFFSYGFHFKPPEQLTPQERAALVAYMQRCQAVSGTPFGEGHTPGLHMLAHLWEPVRTMHLPLCVYLGAELMRLGTAGLLLLSGFRPHSHQGFRYWVRSAAAAAPLRPGQLTPAGVAAAPQGLTETPSGRFTVAEPSAKGAGAGATAAAGAAGSASQEGREAAGGAARARGPPCLDRESSNKSLREYADSEDWTHVERGGEGGGAAAGGGAGGRGGEGQPSGAQGSASPIVFLHGVGLGLTPYIRFVSDLMLACPHRPCVLLEAPHVSVGLAQRSVTTDDVAGALAGVLARHGWGRAAILAHSYGTFVVSRLVQRFPELIEAMALVDPVCVLSVYPQLLANFVYKPASGPWGGNPVTAGIDFIRYVFSRDPSIAQTFCRQFVWHRECLFPEDMPPHSLLVLAGLDDLVPCDLILKRLQQIESPVGVEHAASLPHGGFLFDPEWRGRVVRRVAQLFGQAEAEAAG